MIAATVAVVSDWPQGAILDLQAKRTMDKCRGAPRSTLRACLALSTAACDYSGRGLVWLRLYIAPRTSTTKGGPAAALYACHTPADLTSVSCHPPAPGKPQRCHCQVQWPLGTCKPSRAEQGLKSSPSTLRARQPPAAGCKSYPESLLQQSACCRVSEAACLTQAEQYSALQSAEGARGAQIFDWRGLPQSACAHTRGRTSPVSGS